MDNTYVCKCQEDMQKVAVGIINQARKQTEFERTTHNNFELLRTDTQSIEQEIDVLFKEITEIRRDTTFFKKGLLVMCVFELLSNFILYLHSSLQG